MRFIVFLKQYSKKHKGISRATSFPGPLLFPSPGAREEGKRRGPGNEVVSREFSAKIDVCLYIHHAKRDSQ